MNYIFLIFKIIFLILIMQISSFAKGLPPGTGESDIPANILILLDKSGSMDEGPGALGMDKPQAIAIDETTGDLYIAIMNNTISKFSYSTLVRDDTWANGSYTDDPENNCTVNNVKELRIHGNKLYVISNGSAKIFRIDLTTEICDWHVDATSVMSMDIQDNFLYSFGNDINVFDLSGATPQKINCSYDAGSDLFTYGSAAEAMAVDSSRGNLYFQTQTTGSFIRFQINQNGNKCPNLNKAAEFTSTGVSIAYSMKFEPGSDTTLYVPDYHDQFYKYELNASGNSIDSSTTKGSYVGSAASTSSNLYVDYPYAIDVDGTANRVIFVSRGWAKSVVHVLEYNLDFIKETETGPTRMDGAHAAIQALVSDSSLTQHVDFGFGFWSDSGGTFSDWTGDDESTDEIEGDATPCTSSNCLKVQVHRHGFTVINDTVTEVTPGGGTSATSFANMASQYYLHSTLSPIDDSLDCQDSYVIVIGDGVFNSDDEVEQAKTTLAALASREKPIKTFMVAYGGDISSSGLADFNELAASGGTEEVLIADTAPELVTQLRAKVTEVIAEKLAFTAPSVPLDTSSDGSLYQSSFHYQQNQEWQGELIRTKINSDGSLDTSTSAGNWSAKTQMPEPSSRKIWTTLADTDYAPGYNNFVTGNLADIEKLFRIFSHVVSDYHSDTQTPIGTRRCATTPGVVDGNSDDKLGLINFVRGQDYFDYDADCNLTEKRTDKVTGANAYLGDIYHSELVVIGAPSAQVSFTGTNQEAYWRYINNYQEWATSANLVNRKRMIYVGANDGMLHAFNASSGVEEWAFIPPFMVSKFPLYVDASLNEETSGGSVALFGVDGSPTVHDMYFKGPLATENAWRTILMIPYGRGGNGFSILDVTDSDAPLHLISIYNDVISHTVHVIDHESNHTEYYYVSNSYNITSFEEAKQVILNHEAGTGTATCDGTTNNQCYLSQTWTLVTSPKTTDLEKEDFVVRKDGADTTDFNVTYDGNGDLVFTFDAAIRYAAYDNPEPASTSLGVRIVSGNSTGVQSPNDIYDYSKLGESWSSPRIIRLPSATGNDNINNDKYVAIMGGGYGTQNQGVGSNLFIINLEDTTGDKYGQVHKVIDIEDSDSNSIVNSTPGLPVVITPDTATGISYRGALVYLNDLEGKITKINLTNMSKDDLGNEINLYDSTTLFDVGATVTNGRYMYHSMEAAIGKTTGNLWLFSGTGDYERLTDKDDDIDNLLIGIKDKHFPYYNNQASLDPPTTNDITNCKNTTPVTGSASECPGDTDLGWYIKLDESSKVSAEPTVSKGTVYFPIYTPSESENRCSMGSALICAVDDECGTPINDKIGSTSASECRLVGQGVLSKIIVFADKLFANIAGEGAAGAIQGEKKDLISIGAAIGEVDSYRSSWRENY